MDLEDFDLGGFGSTSKVSKDLDRILRILEDLAAFGWTRLVSDK